MRSNEEIEKSISDGISDIVKYVMLAIKRTDQEVISNSVNEYLKNNPIDGVDEEKVNTIVSSSINDYFTKNPIDNISEKEISDIVSDCVKDLKNSVNSLTESVRDVNDDISDLKTKRYIFIGDSYGEGYSPDGNVTSWVDRVISKLGLTSGNYYKNSRGGCGFSNTNSYYNFLTLMQNLYSSVNDPSTITDIVVCGGYNDNSWSNDDCSSGLTSFINYCKNTYPNAKINLGFVGSSIDTEVLSKLNTKVQLYSSFSSKYVRFLNGLENVLHLDTLMSSDGFHPNAIGQEEIATAIVNALQTGNCTVYRRGGATVTALSDWTISKPNNFVSCQKNDTVKLIAEGQTYTHDAFNMWLNGTEYPLADLTNTVFFGEKYSFNSVTLPCYLELSGMSYKYIGAMLTFTISNRRLSVKGIKINDAGNNYASYNVIKIMAPKFTIIGHTATD